MECGKGEKQHHTGGRCDGVNTSILPEGAPLQMVRSSKHFIGTYPLFFFSYVVWHGYTPIFGACVCVHTHTQKITTTENCASPEIIAFTTGRRGG